MLESVLEVILRLLVDALGDPKVHGCGITLTFCCVGLQSQRVTAGLGKVGNLFLLRCLSGYH